MDPANPLVLAILSLCTFIFVVGFTRPTDSTRQLGLFFMLVYVAMIITSKNHSAWFSHPIYPNLLGGMTFSTLLQYFDQAILQGWSYEAQAPTATVDDSRAKDTTKSSEAKGGVWDRIKFGLSLTFNKRRAGTPWASKNIPHFDEAHPLFVPSRLRFISTNLVRCFICVIFLDLIGMAGQDTSQNHIIFDQRLVPLFSRLRELTAEEMAVRVMVSFLTALGTYLLFQAIYSGCAVVMVATGLNSTESWRPLFGSITQCTSLRGVWNKFWHQGMGTTLTVPARYITAKVLRLGRRSILQRYAYTMVVFQLSGLVHIIGDVAAGMSITESGVMQWFSIQALGFAIEDGVSWLWRVAIGRRDDKEKIWQKVVGFIWVVGWFVWTMPVWTYPISRVSEGEGILPFSIVQRFVVKR